MLTEATTCKKCQRQKQPRWRRWRRQDQHCKIVQITITYFGLFAAIRKRFKNGILITYLTITRWMSRWAHNSKVFIILIVDVTIIIDCAKKRTCRVIHTHPTIISCKILMFQKYDIMANAKIFTDALVPIRMDMNKMKRKIGRERQAKEEREREL